MEERKVIVKSLINGIVGINVPDLLLKRTWEKKGAEKPINFNDLQQAIYDPGVEYMFTQGILGIDSLQDKIDLGLEPEDAKESVNIIVLTDAQKKRYMTVAPIYELEEIVKKLPREQLNDLVDYAIENEYTDVNRCEVLKKATQRDVLRAVQLNRQNKED